MLFSAQVLFYKIYSATNDGWILLLTIGVFVLTFGAIVQNRQNMWLQNMLNFHTAIEKSIVIVFLIISGIALREPLGIGLIILAISIFIKPQYRFRGALVYIGLIYSLVSLYYMITYRLFSAWHSATWISVILLQIFRILGISCSNANGFLQASLNGELYRFAISYEQSGFWYFLLIFITAIIFMILKRQKVTRFLITLFICIIYFIIRYAIMLILYSHEKSIGIFYSFPLIFVSYVPLCAIAAYQIEVSGSESTRDFSPVYNKHDLLIAASLALAVGFTIISIALPIGKKKNGIVYIDDYHSDGWEEIEQPLNTEEFGGQKSSYTYYSLVEMLKKQYEVVVISEAEQYEQLTSNDILILKTPTVSFSENEIAQIDTFLKSGGGLWTIGDHTNLFSMNTHLNSITKQYGIEYQNDAVYDLSTTGLTTYDNPYNLFSNYLSQDLWGYEFATGCSIKSDFFTNKVIVDNNACSEQWDLSQQNYFGDLSLSEEEHFGLFEMCVAKSVKKGRIVAFADSTTFSSFSVHMHKNPEFVFTVIDYLNHSNKINLLQICAFLLWIIFACCLVLSRKKLHLFTLAVLSIAFVLAAAGVSSKVISINGTANNNRIKNELGSIQSVYFINRGKDLLPSFIGVAEPGEYSSFFMAFQRKGYFTRESAIINDCFMRDENTIVILDPEMLTHQEMYDLTHYAENHGGKIIICMSHAPMSSSLDLLSHVGINYYLTNQMQSIQIPGKEPFESGLLVNKDFYALSTPDNVFTSDEFYDVRIDKYAYANQNGSIYVFFYLDMFDNIMISEPGTAPTATQKMLFDELFHMIDFVYE